MRARCSCQHCAWEFDQVAEAERFMYEAISHVQKNEGHITKVEFWNAQDPAPDDAGS